MSNWERALLKFWDSCDRCSLEGMQHSLKNGHSWTWTMLVPVVYCIWDGTYGFGWGKIHFSGRVKGWPWNRDFFGPWNGNERSECHFGPSLWISPHPNPYVPPHIDYRNINSYDGNMNKNVCVLHFRQPFYFCKKIALKRSRSKSFT